MVDLELFSIYFKAIEEALNIRIKVDLTDNRKVPKELLNAKLKYLNLYISEITNIMSNLYGSFKVGFKRNNLYFESALYPDNFGAWANVSEGDGFDITEFLENTEPTEIMNMIYKIIVELAPETPVIESEDLKNILKMRLREEFEQTRQRKKGE